MVVEEAEIQVEEEVLVLQVLVVQGVPHLQDLEQQIEVVAEAVVKIQVHRHLLDLVDLG